MEDFGGRFKVQGFRIIAFDEGFIKGSAWRISGVGLRFKGFGFQVKEFESLAWRIAGLGLGLRFKGSG